MVFISTAKRCSSSQSVPGSVPSHPVLHLTLVVLIYSKLCLNVPDGIWQSPVSRGSVEVRRESVEVSRSQYRVSRESVDISRGSVDISRESVDISRESLEVSKSQ